MTDVDLDRLTEIVFVFDGFSIIKLLSFLSPYCTFWKEVTLHSPHLSRE